LKVSIHSIDSTGSARVKLAEGSDVAVGGGRSDSTVTIADDTRVSLICLPTPDH
jgi:hypothetical protein